MRYVNIDAGIGLWIDQTETFNAGGISNEEFREWIRERVERCNIGTLRELCTRKVDDESKDSFLYTILLTQLSSLGLHMEMSSNEIMDYEYLFSPHEDIDWEQRRWKLAQRFYARDKEISFEEAMEKAEDSIMRYINHSNRKYVL